MINPPPARYSIRQDDYDPAVGVRIVVTLDGKIQDKVIAYDVEAGFVTRYCSDADGNFYLDLTTEEAAVEEVTGRVIATWRTADTAQ